MYQNLIRKRRQELGLSQTRLACLVGMAGSTLSNLETGKWPAWPKARRSLANALKMAEHDLFPAPEEVDDEE